MWDRGTTHASKATFKRLRLTFGEKEPEKTEISLHHDGETYMEIKHAGFYRAYSLKEEDISRIARLAAFQIVPVIPGEGRILQSPSRTLEIEGCQWNASFTWNETGAYPHWENLEHIAHAIMGLAAKNTGWTVEDEAHHLIRLYPEMQPPWKERYSHV